MIGVAYSPTRYVTTMPEEVQKEIRQQVVSALTVNGDFKEEDVERAMSSRISDLEDLIDVSKYTTPVGNSKEKATELLNSF